MYYFLIKQIRLYKKNDLDKQQKLIIKYLIDKYKIEILKNSAENKQTVEIKANYIALLNYVKINHKLPSNNEELKFLNQFFFKQQKLFVENQLEELYIQKYIEIKSHLKY